MVFLETFWVYVSAIEVTDGETVQNKAFEYAFGVLHARGFADQEDAHAKWNCFKKAVSRANLSMGLLRLTLICTLGKMIILFFSPNDIFQGTHKKTPFNHSLTGRRYNHSAAGTV